MHWFKVERPPYWFWARKHESGSGYLIIVCRHSIPIAGLVATQIFSAPSYLDQETIFLAARASRRYDDRQMPSSEVMDVIFAWRA